MFWNKLHSLEHLGVQCSGLQFFVNAIVPQSQQSYLPLLQRDISPIHAVQKEKRIAFITTVIVQKEQFDVVLRHQARNQAMCILVPFEA